MRQHPPTQLLELLAAYRWRGATFDAAWRAAMWRLFGAEQERPDPSGWHAALAATKPAWRSAYNRVEPKSAELSAELAA